MRRRIAPPAATVFVGLALLAALGRYAAADDVVRAETACVEGGALRQTIVLLDEALVTAGKLGDPATLRWSRPILELADAVGDAPGRNLLPHEHLAVYLARRSGQDLVPLFSGCSPEPSTGELDKLKAKDTALARFFGSGSSARLRERREAFQAALLKAFNQALALGAGARQESAPASFFRSVRSGGRFVDLYAGIPRILMVSAFALADAAPLADAASARRQGFDEAAEPSLDLERAEVYALTLREHDAPFLHDYLDAYMLRSRGSLAGWRTSGLPVLREPPRIVSVFGGTIDYAGASRPAQLRVALDAHGALVNSWIEVTTSRSVDTPLSGRAVCAADRTCRIAGDGTGLGQSWNPDPEAGQDAPSFSPKLPFGGFRFFEIGTAEAAAEGRIFDPKAQVEIRDANGQPKIVEAFTFTLPRIKGGRF